MEVDNCGNRLDFDLVRFLIILRKVRESVERKDRELFTLQRILRPIDEYELPCRKEHPEEERKTKPPVHKETHAFPLREYAMNQ